MRKEKWFIYVSFGGERNLQPYQSDKDLEKSKANPDKPQFFSTQEKITEERVIFYNERHAVAYGGKMREYLGMVEIDPGNIDERKIYNMIASEIRDLNLPKIQPNKGINRVVVKGGQTYLWADYFKGR